MALEFVFSVSFSLLRLILFLCHGQVARNGRSYVLLTWKNSQLWVFWGWYREGLFSKKAFRTYLWKLTQAESKKKKPVCYITAKPAKMLRKIKPDLLRILVLIPLKSGTKFKISRKNQVNWILCNFKRNRYQNFQQIRFDFPWSFGHWCHVCSEEIWFANFWGVFSFFPGNYPVHVLCQSGKLPAGAYFGRRYSRQSPNLLLPSELGTCTTNSLTISLGESKKNNCSGTFSYHHWTRAIQLETFGRNHSWTFSVCCSKAIGHWPFHLISPCLSALRQLALVNQCTFSPNFLQSLNFSKKLWNILALSDSAGVALTKSSLLNQRRVFMAEKNEKRMHGPSSWTD